MSTLKKCCSTSIRMPQIDMASISDNYDAVRLNVSPVLNLINKSDFVRKTQEELLFLFQ